MSDFSFHSSDDEPKASLPPRLLQSYVGHKYSHLASLDYVKAIARTHRNKTHMVGDKRVLNTDIVHGPNSLDTIIYKALNLVRNVNPEWEIELIRFETISRVKEAVLPSEKYERKLNKKSQWKRRNTSCEYILIPHTKFTTYIAMDDSYNDQPSDLVENPCEPFERNLELEEPLLQDQLEEWVEESMQREEKEEVKEDEEEGEEAQ